MDETHDVASIHDRQDSLARAGYLQEVANESLIESTASRTF